MANLRAEPKQLAQARRCGARARTRGGAPCRAPAVGGKRRCRLHGGARGSGGQLGPKNGAYRHGKRTKRAKEVIAMFREMRQVGETLVARVMNAHGLKPTKALRRRTHVKRALAEAKASKGEKTE
jgi:hypothetical protein